MKPSVPTSRDRPWALPCDRGMAMATLAVALHMAVLAHRMSSCRSLGRPVAAWACPCDGGKALPECREPEDAPSHPSGHFSAGFLPLTAGVVVLALTRWLQIMRISTPLGW